MKIQQNQANEVKEQKHKNQNINGEMFNFDIDEFIRREEAKIL